MQPRPVCKNKMSEQQENGDMETETETVVTKKRRHTRTNSLSVIQLEHVDLVEKLYEEFCSFKTSIKEDLKGVKEEVRLLRVEMLKTSSPEIDNQRLDAVVGRMEAISNKMDKPSNATDDSSKRQSSSNTNLKEELLKKLNERKVHYYTFLHNNDRYNLYTGWAEQNPPFLPSKFIPVEISGEPEEEYLTRLKLKKMELECYLERLKFRAESAKQKYEEIDSLVVLQIYENKNDEDVIKKTIDWWNKRIKEEETLSKNIWEKKKANIEKVPENQRNSGIIVAKDILYADVVRQGEDVDLEEEPKYQVVRNRKDRRNNKNNNYRQSNNRSNYNPSYNRKSFSQPNRDSRYNNNNGNRFRQQNPPNSRQQDNNSNNNGQRNGQPQNRDVNQSSGRGGTEQNFRRRGFPERGRTWSTRSRTWSTRSRTR